MARANPPQAAPIVENQTMERHDLDVSKGAKMTKEQRRELADKMTEIMQTPEGEKMTIPEIRAMAARELVQTETEQK